MASTESSSPISRNRGFFVEAGAHDGYVQSNTYFLERFKGWDGVLVEPIPEVCVRCVVERPRSKVFNCALVSRTHVGDTVEMWFGDLFSLVTGAQGSFNADDLHVRTGAAATYRVEVPARTLSSILEEVGHRRSTSLASTSKATSQKCLRASISAGTLLGICWSRCSTRRGRVGESTSFSARATT
jgi:hypothetical protein